MTTLYQFFETC
jgi:hypothetical protein